MTRRYLNNASRWRAVKGRDKAADGFFYYAVSTTGVYCRPSCPARLARREHVTFHLSPESAERAGFRACKGCHPRGLHWHERHARIVAISGRSCRIRAFRSTSRWRLSTAFIMRLDLNQSLTHEAHARAYIRSSGTRTSHRRRAHPLIRVARASSLGTYHKCAEREGLAGASCRDKRSYGNTYGIASGRRVLLWALHGRVNSAGSGATTAARRASERRRIRPSDWSTRYTRAKRGQQRPRNGVLIDTR